MELYMYYEHNVYYVCSSQSRVKVEICVWDFIGGGILTPGRGWGWGFGSRKQNHGALWQRHLFLISDDPLLSMMRSLFTVEHDFNCGLLVSGLYCAQAYSFYTRFFESSRRERRLNFSVAFLPLERWSWFCPLFCHWAVPLIGLHLPGGPSLFPARRLNLNVACDCLVCCWMRFVNTRNLYIYIHQGYWSVIFFCSCL